MLFAATNKHDGKKCPLKTEECVEMLKEIFSEKNIKKQDINLEEAYISCPKGKHSTHKGFYMINTENIKSFFKPLNVEIKEVVPFNYKNI